MTLDVFTHVPNSGLRTTKTLMEMGYDGVEFAGHLKKYPGRSLTVHIKEWSDTKKDALLGEEKDAYAPLTAVDLCLQYYRKLRA